MNNPQNITLRKSPGKLILYIIITLATGAVALFTLLAIFSATFFAQRLGLSIWFLTVFSAALASGFNIPRNLGALKVRGTLMTEEGPGDKQSIDLKDITSIQAETAENIEGVTFVGNTVSDDIKSTALTLVLTAIDDTKFTLRPDLYRAAERVKIAPVLTELMRNEHIAKSGPVDQAAGIWFTVDPNTQTVTKTQLVASGATKKQQSKKMFISVGIIVLVGVIIFGILGVADNNQTSFCSSLAKNHRIVTADITGLSPEQYTDMGGRSYWISSDIEHAQRVVVSVSYEVDGKFYSQTINAGYHDTSYLKKLYNAALSGSLDVAYIPGHPDKVRPALELGAKPGSALCAQ